MTNRTKIVRGHENLGGPSFAAPMLQVFRHKLPDSSGQLVTFPEAVERGWIATSGERARRVYIEENPPERPGTNKIHFR